MSAIGYILRSYPRLSQTFIANEVWALEQFGLAIHIFALSNPHEPVVQVQVDAIQSPVDYLDAATWRRTSKRLGAHLRVALGSPRRYFKTLRYVLRRADLDAGYSAGSRYSCFVQAVYLTRLLQQERRRTGRTITHLHAHFAHDPTLIALLAHMLTGISYSFTAHARDLYQVPAAALAERIASASVVITCCEANIGYLKQLTPAGSGANVRLIHHGVDLHSFQPAPRVDRSAEPPLILSVGRLVEKKGFADLLRACEQIKRAGCRFRCVIYGDGPLRAELDAMIARMDLAGDVTLAGACSQRELLPVFQRADIFALAPFVTEDGDRDGIPNVLAEAMACGLPVVTTSVAGIPELVRHNHNGLLTAPRDVDGLAAALTALIADQACRQRLGTAARRTVVEHFDLRTSARQIAALFEQLTAKDAGQQEQQRRRFIHEGHEAHEGVKK